MPAWASASVASRSTGVDLTSPAGKMNMGVIAAVAGFKRNLLTERTQSGLACAKAQGKTLGRPQALSSYQRNDVLKRLAAGEAVAAAARAEDQPRDRDAHPRRARCMTEPAEGRFRGLPRPVQRSTR